MRVYGAAAAAAASRTYAPRPDVSALATGLRVDPLDGARVELAPCVASFPTIADVKANPGVNAALYNPAGYTSIAASAGALAVTIAAGGFDFNTATHGGPHLAREIPWSGQGLRLTTHISGAAFTTTTKLLGLGIWDPRANGRTARILVGYESGANKVYGEYATVGASASVTLANITSPGVWLEIEISADGTYTSRYQVAAAGARPAAGWTTHQTVAAFMTTYTGTQWTSVRYGLTGLSVTTSTLASVNVYDDSRMTVSGGVRSALEGVGIGVSASSPEITLVNAAPVDWTVCTQAALQAALGAVCTLRDGETGTVQCQINGGSWVGANAVDVGTGDTLTCKARLVSTGLTLASLNLDAIQSLRLT